MVEVASETNCEDDVDINYFSCNAKRQYVNN